MYQKPNIEVLLYLFYRCNDIIIKIKYICIDTNVVIWTIYKYCLFSNAQIVIKFCSGKF